LEARPRKSEFRSQKARGQETGRQLADGIRPSLKLRRTRGAANRRHRAWGGRLRLV